MSLQLGKVARAGLFKKVKLRVMNTLLLRRGAAVAVVAGLFVAARFVASWRPHKIAHLSFQRGDSLGGPNARLSGDGRFLLLRPFTQSGEKLLVWDTATWKLKRQVPMSTDGLVGGAAAYDVSPDGQQLVALRALAPANILTPTGAMTGHNLGVVSSLDGSNARALDKPGGATARFLDGDARFSRDGSQIWATSSSWLLVWNAASGQQIRFSALSSPTDVHWGSCEAVLSPDARIVARSDAAHLTLWDVRTKPRLLGAPTIGFHPVFSPDSRRLLYCANGGHTLVCADAATGRTMWTTTSDRAARNLIWSRDGRAVFALAPPQILAFSASTGEPLGARRVLPAVQILPAPENGHVWFLDINAGLWSQRVY